VRRPWRPSAALGRFVAVAITAVGALALASSSVALAAVLSHSPRASTPTQALPSTDAVASAATISASQVLGQVLQADFPRSFGGIAIDDQKIAVYMTRMPHGLASLVRANAPVQTVTYHHSAHTFASLLWLHQRLGRDWMYFQSLGADVVGFHPDVVSSTEQIDVINPSPSQVALIEEHFAPRTVSIVTVGVAPMPAVYTERVESGGRGGSFPWDVVPVIAGLEAGLIALVGFVLARTR
jgi:hypothetical protein